MLSGLPLCLFGPIQEFLVTFSIDDEIENRKENLKSWRNCCNTSHLLNEVKRCFIYYNFNVFFSFSYLVYTTGYNASHLDEKIPLIAAKYAKCRPVIEAVIKIVKNSSKQIYLEFFCAKSLADNTKFDSLCSIIVKGYFQSSASLTYGIDGICFRLQTARYLDFPTRDMKHVDFALISCERDKKYDSMFSNVKTFLIGGSFADASFLSQCNDVAVFNNDLLIDVSPLKNVKKVGLAFCMNIIDVSPLKNAHYLNLSHCYQITDVSMLGKVKKLMLNYCQGVTDISPLHNVKYLDVTGILTIKKFLPRVNKVKTLLFSVSTMKKMIETHPVVQRRQHILVAGDCNTQKLKSLKEYHQLTVIKNDSLVTIKDLIYLRRLTLTECLRLSSIDNLPYLTHLTVNGLPEDDCVAYPELSNLPQLKFLSLSWVSECCRCISLPTTVRHVVMKNCEFLGIILTSSISCLSLVNCPSPSPVIVCGSFEIDHMIVDKNGCLVEKWCVTNTLSEY
jgi:hypothetical protein